MRLSAGGAESEGEPVCLVMPGQAVEVVDERNRLARIDVAGIRPRLLAADETDRELRDRLVRAGRRTPAAG